MEKLRKPSTDICFSVTSSFCFLRLLIRIWHFFFDFLLYKKWVFFKLDVTKKTILQNWIWKRGLKQRLYLTMKLMVSLDLRKDNNLVYFRDRWQNCKVPWLLTTDSWNAGTFTFVSYVTCCLRAKEEHDKNLKKEIRIMFT